MTQFSTASTHESENGRVSRAAIGAVDPALCPLCTQRKSQYLFPLGVWQVTRCEGCGLTRLAPNPTATVQVQLNGALAEDLRHDREATRTEHKAAQNYCDVLAANGISAGDLLIACPPSHPILSVARGRGYAVDRIVDVDAPALELSTGYDAALVIFELERSARPMRLLEVVRGALRTDGLVLIVTPSLDSFSARLLRSKWTEWRPENMYYFDSRTIQAALSQTGFEPPQIQVDRRSYSVEHLAARARTSPSSWLTRTLTATYDVIPHNWAQRAHLQLPASGMIVTARRKASARQPLLSIVMPVFNERRTFAAVLDRVLAKRLDGIDKEIILVESNSTDGTRDAVLRYDGQPGVTVVLQDQPRGKGNAVREGLAHARGDFILIQDADDEYDVNDYDALLEPLKNGTRAFVLGSRHAGGWKIREFNDQPFLAAFFNFGHVIFLGLFNAMYGQTLTDPFTMYKVFRRDCLRNVQLECDRFDFDFELVIKLIRSGYRPVEIPVNYRARSFSEGKKVSAVRDPLTWIRALVKYRVSPIRPPTKR